MPEYVEISWDEALSEERDMWVWYNVMGHTESPDLFPPRYTTDPAEDYEVLQRVRDEWMSNLNTHKFVCHLKDIWRLRGRGAVSCGLPWCVLDYRPGDYSHAAYLAMGGE